MKMNTTSTSANAPYSVDDYEILVRFDPQSLEFTAQVVELPGIILGGVTPEAALSQTRWLLGSIIKDYAARGDTLAPPGSRPPPTDEEETETASERTSAAPAIRSSTSTLTHRNGKARHASSVRPLRRRRVSHSPKKELATAA